MAHFAIRLRDDLEVYPQQQRDRSVWVVKDPLSLKYFQFTTEEYAILSWLDGTTDLEGIKDRFERLFSPQRTSLSQLQSFVGNLHRNGLVLSDAMGQGEQIAARFRATRWHRFKSALSNPLAIQFRGLDPARLIDWLYPKVRFLFSARFLCLYLVLVVSVLVFFASQADAVASRLPDLQQVLSRDNLIWLALAMAMTKVIHELGHALTCKHFGGECHEMGIMLLVMTPCLYCNVSDSWTMPRRYRIAIVAAGIIVELVLAAIYSLLWWYSHPGAFHSICFNVMLVCSVGTLLLNGNPLLRYDAYYILSDYLEMPNLWQDSSARLRSLLSRSFLGYDSGRTLSQDHGRFQLAYAIASVAYRTIVMASILYLMYQVLKPMGLAFLAHVLTTLVLISLFARPVSALVSTMMNPAKKRRFKPRRFAFSTVLVVVVFLVVLFLPVPYSIKAPVTVQPLDARSVYVSVPGILQQCVAVGDVVREGDVLAELENPELARELERLRGECAVQQVRIRNLETMRAESLDLSEQLPTAREILLDLKARVRQLERESKSLSLVAPQSGTILAPPSVQETGAHRDKLPRWIGSPMDDENLGADIESRTLFCMIGDSDRFEVLGFVHQSQIPFIATDQSVQLSIEMAGGQTLSGIVAEISQANVDEVPLELAVDQEMSNFADSDGITRPEETWYQIRIHLDQPNARLLIGARGRARISVAAQPLGRRIYRVLARTFKPVI